MPLIQITAPSGMLTKDRQDELVSRVSGAIVKAEGASPSDPAARALTWAYFNELPATSCYVGGRNLEAPPMRIAITTPEGALDDAGRKALVQEVGGIVDDLVGPYEGRLNHWLMLDELPEGGWGGGGQIFGLADIQAAMNVTVASV